MWRRWVVAHLLVVAATTPISVVVLTPLYRWLLWDGGWSATTLDLGIAAMLPAFIMTGTAYIQAKMFRALNIAVPSRWVWSSLMSGTLGAVLWPGYTHIATSVGWSPLWPLLVTLGCLLGVSLVQWRLMRRHAFHARWWIVAGLLGAWIGGGLSHVVVQVDWGNDLISIVLQYIRVGGYYRRNAQVSDTAG